MERRFTHYRPKEEQRIGEVTPIYTAPPKREWVGLDKKDLSEIDPTSWKLVCDIEAKLKEKNNG